MEEKRNAYRLLVGKPEGKIPLGRPRRRWVDNIKMDLLEMAGKETTRNRHTRETKGTNEHDWKETAIFLQTSINT
jgi:hypothetical protein